MEEIRGLTNELDDFESADGGMRELALFAGAGGGILGGKLIGWQTVCGVEWNAYAASVLLARQNDGILAPFPIWDDVQTFDGKPWRGIVDVVSGGFPCQDISAAGKGAGITGERSGMWSHMARIIGEVRPRYAYIENSPMLITRGLDVVLSDLAALGYDAEWGVVSASDCGAPHKRERIWIVATDTQSARAGEDKRWLRGLPERCGEREKGLGQEAASVADPQKLQRNGGGNNSRISVEPKQKPEFGNDSWPQVMADPASVRQQRQGEPIDTSNSEEGRERQTGNAINECQRREWPPEPGVGRKINGLA